MKVSFEIYTLFPEKLKIGKINDLNRVYKVGRRYLSRTNMIMEIKRIGIKRINNSKKLRGVWVLVGVAL
jgi:hypothetical protein